MKRPQLSDRLRSERMGFEARRICVFAGLKWGNDNQLSWSDSKGWSTETEEKVATLIYDERS